MTRMSYVLIALMLSLVNCKRVQIPIDFSVDVPAEDEIAFQAQLRNQYGLGMSGTFDILKYGSIFLVGETSTEGFKFGLDLKTDSFLQANWVGYKQTSTLPTGAGFPAWVSTEVVDVTIPKADTQAVKWHFYFGTQGQKIIGSAAVVNAINSGIPSVNLGYNFYDSQGRVILGITFFGPANGSSGGFFIGTNLTPFLTPGEAIESLREVAYTELEITGEDAPFYQSRKRIQRLTNAFIDMTQNLE